MAAQPANIGCDHRQATALLTRRNSPNPFVERTVKRAKESESWEETDEIQF